MMFDVFDSLLIGQEIEFEGKKYLRLKTLRDGLLMAVELGSTMPSPVVVIKDPNYKEQPKDGDTK